MILEGLLSMVTELKEKQEAQVTPASREEIEWVAKIGFLIGNDLETSEVLYSALLNPKNADFKCKGSGLVWIIIILVL